MQKPFFKYSQFLFMVLLSVGILSCSKLIDNEGDEETDGTHYEQIDYNFEWVKKVEDIYSYLLTTPRCASDNDGNLVFSVSFPGKMAIDGDSVYAKKGYADEIYIVKYNPDGEKLWDILGGTKLQYYCGGNVAGNDNIFDIQIDKENNIYVFGSICGNYFEFGDKVFGVDIFGSDDLSNSFLMKISSEGNIEWAKGFIDFDAYFKLFPNGDLIVASHIPLVGQNRYSQNIMLTKMDSNGETLFTKEILLTKVAGDLSVFPHTTWANGNVQVEIDENNDIFINAPVNVFRNDTVQIKIEGQELFCFRDISDEPKKVVGFIARLNQDGEMEMFSDYSCTSSIFGDDDRYGAYVEKFYPDNQGGGFIMPHQIANFRQHGKTVVTAGKNYNQYLVKFDNSFNVIKTLEVFETDNSNSYASLELETVGIECYIYGTNNGLNLIGGNTINQTDTYLFGKVSQNAKIEWLESSPEKKYGVRNIDIPSNMPKYVYGEFEGAIEFNTGDRFTTNNEAGYIGKISY